MMDEDDDEDDDDDDDVLLAISKIFSFPFLAII
jgi:hypothetical protein